VERKATPYCKPSEAGLASEESAVARRIGRLFDALDTEVNPLIVNGPKHHAGQQMPIGQESNGILDDLAAFRVVLIERLESEGWSLSYNGGNKMRVRGPNHKRPFPRRIVAERAS
jgi:hypothetical protein